VFEDARDVFWQVSPYAIVIPLVAGVFIAVVIPIVAVVFVAVVL
jgi:hypothetical protein